MDSLLRRRLVEQHAPRDVEMRASPGRGGFDERDDRGEAHSDPEDDLDPNLTTVHRVAFRSRTRSLRDNHLCTQLATEHAYNEHLYAMCKQYERKFHQQYSQYKRQLAKEQFLEDDWEALSSRQRTALVLHRPMLTNIGRFVAMLSTAVVLLSAVCLSLETVPQFNPNIPENEDNRVLFNVVEGLVTVYLTFETLIAFLSHPARLDYIRTAQFATDFLSCLPLYLTLFFGTFVPAVSSYIDPLRMLRLFRLIKYVGTLRPVATLINALTKSISVLSGPLFFLTATCIVAAAALYYAQRGEYDEARGEYLTSACNCEASARAVNTSSGSCPDVTTKISHGVPTTTWWGFVTILTVGYGDVVPECALGKVIAAICMIISSIVMAMPIAILGENFTDEASRVDDEVAQMKASLAKVTAKEHERVLQLACARRLHEIRPDKLVKILNRAGLPARGQPEDMQLALYRLLGVDPDGDGNTSSKQGGEVARSMHGLPAVLTLAEAFVDYLRMRVPFEIVDLKHPTPEVSTIIDTFFERAYGWWAKQETPHLSHRLECSHKKACQRIVPLVSTTEYSIGIHIDGVPPPDIALPLVSQAVVGSDRVVFGPRMAVLRVVRRFGAVVYIIAPCDTFRPMVNGRVIDGELELRDRDVINFGTEDVPVLYTFARFDEFAHGHSAGPAVAEDLPTRLWAERNPITRVMQPVDLRRVEPEQWPATANERRAPPLRDWHVAGDADAPPRATREGDLQPKFFL